MNVTKFLFASLFVASSAFAAPAPDYGPINKALGDFLAVIDNLRTELPKIRDAAGAAKAVDSFATVTNGFAAALEDYNQKYPEVAHSPQPPPEMADVLKKFMDSKDRYPTLGADLGSTIRPFADDPMVRAAIGRFQQALARVNKLSGAQ